MMAGQESRMDFTWRRANLAAILAILIAGGALLGWKVTEQSVRAGEQIPVNPSRVAQGRDLINPNTASYASIRRLPGMGQAKAQAIIDWRESHKDLPFREARDLSQIRGIGPVLTHRVAPYLDLPSKTPVDETDDDSADDDSPWQREPGSP
jgi:competence ComEA-like helix-hairpin-helix protein